MVEVVFRLLGGLGLFLVAMGLLTDGLRTFAGDALNRALVRFTGTPFKAFCSGTLVTLAVQSSAATTVALIGFVSAGMMAFPQAVGVVMGASLGTTGTGWIVASLGLKVSLGFYTMPLVGVGAFLRLFAHGRWRAGGTVLAGFGMIFVGIDFLQEGMQGLSNAFALERLPTAGFGAHALIMLIGLVMTVLMQSSTAAVATTLAGLHAGAVSFEQAAVLVIGASIGTTLTGVLAAMGGTVPAKRTALAHVIFNLTTGLIALVILPAFLWLLRMAQEYLGLAAGPVSLAAFHSLFTATGVALFLPFADRYAVLIKRILPEKEPNLARHLDTSLLHVPALAHEVTQRTLVEISDVMMAGVRGILEGDYSGVQQHQREQVREALQRTQNFFARIPIDTEHEGLLQTRLAQMHAIEHLLRLHSRLRLPRGVEKLVNDDSLKALVSEGRQALRLAELGLRGEAPANWRASLQHSAEVLGQARHDMRQALFAQTAEGQMSAQDTLRQTDFLRWLERSAYHAWRVAFYLDKSGADEAIAPVVPDELDALDD